MGGILTEAQRNAALARLRWVAERNAFENAKGRSRDKWVQQLADAWNALPELKGDQIPKPAAIVALLDEMDRRNAAGGMDGN